MHYSKRESRAIALDAEGLTMEGTYTRLPVEGDRREEDSYTMTINTGKVSIRLDSEDQILALREMINIIIEGIME